MKNELQRAKGVRDFGPTEKIERDRIVSTVSNVFESYGYSPIETPIIERYETFASKFGPGEQSDAMKETFKLQDQGKRELVLRNEFTAPFARYVGMNKQLKMPFKRYQIGQIFRDGPLKLGRYREFWQCDIDVVGVPEGTIEVEMIQVAQEVFTQLGLDVEIMINNRKVLNGILEEFGISKDDQTNFLIAIDKLDKIGEAGVKKELQAKKISVKNLKEIFALLSVSGSNDSILADLEKELPGNEGLKSLRTILEFLPESANLKISPTMVRGQAYYTGTIIEVYLKDRKKLGSSLCAGGRYDEMIAGFTGSKQETPAIGISFGLDTILDALTLSNKLGDKKTVTQVYLVVMDQENLAAGFTMAEEIRAQGINVGMDLQGKKMKKNFEYADSLGIPYVAILGEDELVQGNLTLKNMETGKQEKVQIDEIATIVNDIKPLD